MVLRGGMQLCCLGFTHHPFIHSLTHSFSGVCRAPAVCQAHSVLGVMAPKPNQAEKGPGFLVLTHHGESDIKQPHTWTDV